MAEEQTDNARCSFCGSANIVAGIRVGQTAETGSIGLSHRTAILLIGTEPLLADLCDDCGTIGRLYVRNVGKKWIQ